MQPLRTCTRLIFCLFLFLCHTEHMQLGFPQMKPPTHQVQYENLGLPVMTFGFLFPVEHSARATINTHRHTHKHTHANTPTNTQTHTYIQTLKSSIVTANTHSHVSKCYTCLSMILTQTLVTFIRSIWVCPQWTVKI